MAGDASSRAPSRDRFEHGSRIDKGTIIGVFLAFGGIVGGLILEKGTLSDISQLTAAIIVFGGTLGAVLIGTPIPEFLAALRQLRVVLVDPADNSKEILELVISYATKARRSGIVSLENDAEHIQEPFLKKALGFAIDGTELTELKNMMQLDVEIEERKMLSKAKVFESAGGYCPTIGIIGAVLGLIQVMKNLANIEEVGRGIAVAFVATVYGVGAANLLLLPAANKIRNHARRRVEVMELIMQGVLGIVEGLNPKMIRRKLEGLAAASSPVSAGKPAFEEIAAEVPAGEKA